MLTIKRLLKIFQKPPRVIIKRAYLEYLSLLERITVNRKIISDSEKILLQLKKIGVHLATKNQLGICWSFPDSAHVDVAQIIARTKQVMSYQVELLGSGLITLDQPIQWHKDYKTGFDWPNQYAKDIDYNNSERPSDVKFPWELSRLQWLIPIGQAYVISGEEKYAEFVKQILQSWIKANPYAYSVNWACTMEVALRIITWSWFYDVFKTSNAWQDELFLASFLLSLWRHAEFTEKHLEYSDINGNHYTADAAGLVFAGLFFKQLKNSRAQRWLKKGWQILCTELPKQVYADGVDFEASIPYHRLVLELFLLPAIYRQRAGLAIPDFYRQRLIKMADFVAAYMPPNHQAPLIGDADDARVLPFGFQDINDHRYLIGVVGAFFQVPHLLQQFSGPLAEITWLLGVELSSQLADYPKQLDYTARAFNRGGFYILRDPNIHVIVDCGPIGLAGRGGHGHNDCLSFELVMGDEKIITDSGSYVYTASYKERNLFRSTAYHNTPSIDGVELNRFISPDNLWQLHYDAKPEVILWRNDVEQTELKASHSGYLKLPMPVKPIRQFVLNHQRRQLTITDIFVGQGQHQLIIPYHLAAEVQQIRQLDTQQWLLQTNKQLICLHWHGQGEWQIAIQESYVSPSYGRIIPTKKILFITQGNLSTLRLEVSFSFY